MTLDLALDLREAFEASAHGRAERVARAIRARAQHMVFAGPRVSATAMNGEDVGLRLAQCGMLDEGRKSFVLSASSSFLGAGAKALVITCHDEGRSVFPKIMFNDCALPRMTSPEQATRLARNIERRIDRWLTQIIQAGLTA